METVHEKTPMNVTMRTRPTRKCKQTKHYGIDEIYMAEMQTVQSAFSAQLVAEPVSMKQAMESDDGDRWRASAEEEFNSLKEHETWELCELPEGRKVVGSKWVFKVKYAEMEAWTVSNVAQGFSQIPGMDFTETFAPVARFPLFI